MVEQILDWHYKYNLPVGEIDKRLGLPKGTAAKVVVEDWKQAKMKSPRMMQRAAG